MLTILPLGDSITFGCGDSCNNTSKDCEKSPYKQLLKYGVLTAIPCNKCSSGYRGFLEQKLKDNKKFPKFKIVGTRKNGLTKHNGYPGWTIQMVRKKLPVWIKTSPDVILLHLGTNNFGWYRSNAKNTTLELKKMLDEIYDHLPNVKIFLSTIIYASSFYGGKEHDEYNLYIKYLVRYYRNEGKQIFLVNMDQEFNKKNLCPDSIHPTMKGYKVMANVWYKNLIKYISKSKK